MTSETPTTKGGFYYDVTPEQLAAFARLSTKQRLEWVEAARKFTLLAQTPEMRERHERLRRGLPIVP
ncbi:MAG: hypothetical protein FWF20_05685 [Betaproteobacteria bacterium]|nr:hypothetical protein [Betaproteobacteria bacterium]MCL2886263.1 hypothetical protein [Betaproteobacteria bacterium]